MRFERNDESCKKKYNKTTITSMIKSMVIFIVIYIVILLLLIWLSHKYYVPAEM